MRLQLLLLAVLTVAQPLAAAECPPKHLLHIVTRVEGQSVEPGTLAALPRTVFRLGSKYARIEEAPDTQNKIHGLIVVNEPDSWVVNLLDRTGRHVIDRGPTTNVHLPLFGPAAFGKTFPSELARIEMGCERDFFDSYQSPVTTLKSESISKVKQAVGVRDWKLVLVRQDAASPPETLFVFHGEEIVFVVHYLTYEELPSDDLTRFAKPDGIVFAEDPSR
jgi:hypothetical protein